MFLGESPCTGVVPPQFQDFALFLVELHEISVSSPLQPVQVICEFTQGALYLIIQIITEDVKQDWTQY